jgi:hypothetical protein
MPAQVVRSGHHGGRAKCLACLLPADQQDELNADLLRGVPLYRLSKRWSINRESLRAHKANHVSPALVVLRTERIANGVRKVSDRVEDLCEEVQAIYDAARRSRNIDQALKALGKLLAALELLAKITGELDERPQVTINLMQTKEYIELRAVILEVLQPYPEVRRRLSNRLKVLEGRQTS